MIHTGSPQVEPNKSTKNSNISVCVWVRKHTPCYFFQSGILNMKSHFSLIIALIASVINFALLPVSTPLPLESSDEMQTSQVKIRMISRKKRSIDYKPYGFDLELNAFDESQRLQLRSPGYTVFTDSFDYHELSSGANGELIKARKHITKRDLEEIEESMFVDPTASAAVRVQDVDGELHLDGLVGRMRIRRDAQTGDHVGHKHRIFRNTTEDDYVDNHRPIATGRGLPSGPVSAIVELCFIFDYGNAKDLYFDPKGILAYVTPLILVANNHFQTMKDPKISVQLSGFYVFKDAKAQPSKFTESRKTASSWDAWYQLESWAYENINLPKYDVIFTFYSNFEQEGCWEMSNLKGACQVIPAQKKTKSIILFRHYTTGYLNADYFIHQLAHTLGAVDDGTGASAKCSNLWAFAMSPTGNCKYVGNVVRFSECSRAQMKEFIQSTGGHCLHKVSNSKPQVFPPMGRNPTMLQQCQYYLGKNSKVSPVGDAKNECKVTRCDGASAAYEYIQPMEGTPCGKGGKCKNEVCVPAAG